MLNALPVNIAKTFYSLWLKRKEAGRRTIEQYEKFFNLKRLEGVRTNKNNTRLYFPIEDNSVFEEIKTALPGDYSIDINSYKKGFAKKKIVTQRGEKLTDIKIGKVLNEIKRDDLFHKYETDKSRVNIDSERYVVVSRHPYDIAGMTSDRRWSEQSCLRLPTKKIKTSKSSIDFDNSPVIVKNQEIKIGTYYSLYLDIPGNDGYFSWSFYKINKEKLIRFLNDNYNLRGFFAYSKANGSDILDLYNLPDRSEEVFFTMTLKSNNIYYFTAQRTGSKKLYIRIRDLDAIFDIHRDFTFDNLAQMLEYAYNEIPRTYHTKVDEMLRFEIWARYKELKLDNLPDDFFVINPSGDFGNMYSVLASLNTDDSSFSEDYDTIYEYSKQRLIEKAKKYFSESEIQTAGCNARYAKEHAFDSLIAYEIKGSDLNIENPIGRVLINPYYRISDDSALHELQSFFQKYRFIKEWSKGEEYDKKLVTTIDVWRILDEEAYDFLVGHFQDAVRTTEEKDYLHIYLSDEENDDVIKLDYYPDSHFFTIYLSEGVFFPSVIAGEGRDFIIKPNRRKYGDVSADATEIIGSFTDEFNTINKAQAGKYRLFQNLYDDDGRGDIKYNGGTLNDAIYPMPEEKIYLADDLFGNDDNEKGTVEKPTRRLKGISTKRVEEFSTRSPEEVGLNVKDIYIKELNNYQEHFVVLGYDIRLRLVDYVVLATGTQSSATIDSKLLLNWIAINPTIQSIILVHNHPSGNMNASVEDKNLFRNLEDVLKLIQISVVDKIIVTATRDTFAVTSLKAEYTFSYRLTEKEANALNQFKQNNLGRIDYTSEILSKIERNLKEGVNSKGKPFGINEAEQLLSILQSLTRKSKAFEKIYSSTRDLVEKYKKTPESSENDSYRLYKGTKLKYPDAIVILSNDSKLSFEAFGDDAIIVANTTGSILTKIQTSDGLIPYTKLNTQLDNVLPKLVRAGYKVAVLDKLEEPKKQDRINYSDTRKTKVVTPVSVYEAHYDVMELDDLQASNLPNENFLPNPKFPSDCQTRQYYLNEDEKRMFMNIVREFEPIHLINDSPDATTGTPIVTPQGIVLGGNKRTMVLKSISRDKMQLYREMLNAKIGNFGISPETIKGMNKPILVRVIDADTSQCQKISLALNKANSNTYSPLQEGKSASNILKENPLVLERLIDVINQYEFESFREIINNQSANRKIVDLLAGINLINDTNRSQLTEHGLLNDFGEIYLESMLLASIIPSQRLIEGAREFTNKIVQTLPLLYKIEKYPPDYNFVPYLIEAIELEIERRNLKLPTKEVGSQLKMFEINSINPETLQLYILMKPDILQVNIWKKFLQYYTKTADSLIKENSEGNIFGTEPEHMSILEIIERFYRTYGNEVNSFLENKEKNSENFKTIKQRFGLNDGDGTGISKIDNFKESITQLAKWIWKEKGIKVYFRPGEIMIADTKTQQPVGFILVGKDILRVQKGYTDFFGYVVSEENNLKAERLISEINKLTKTRKSYADKGTPLFDEVVRFGKESNVEIPVIVEKPDRTNEIIEYANKEIPRSEISINNNILTITKQKEVLGRIYLNNYSITVKNNFYSDNIDRIRRFAYNQYNSELSSKYTNLQQLKGINANFLMLYDEKNRELFGRLGENFSMLIWGSPGTGKSTLALNLLKDLSNYGSTLYFTTEERVEDGIITERLNLISGDYKNNVWFDDSRNISNLINTVRNKEVKFVIIDSVNKLKMKTEDLSDFIMENKGVNFLLIAHANKDKRTFKGDTDLEHDRDVVVKLKDGYAETTKNRFSAVNKILFINSIGENNVISNEESTEFVGRHEQRGSGYYTKGSR